MTVSLSYEGNVRDDLAGFYFSTYTEGDETMYLAVTQFQSTDARKAFPCMDEPSLKAVFNVKLGRPSAQAWTSASNMPVMNEAVADVEGMAGYVWDEFYPTEKMSTYLVAFLVSQFDRYEGQAFGENGEVRHVVTAATAAAVVVIVATAAIVVVVVAVIIITKIIIIVVVVVVGSCCCCCCCCFCPNCDGGSDGAATIVFSNWFFDNATRPFVYSNCT